MASQNGSITTNEIYGRSITLNWSIASQSSATNKTVINYSIVGSGSLSGDYYVISGPITVNINGTNVYAETGRIAVYKQTLKSGTLEISHNNDGSKTFSASISAAIYDSSINASASGSWELPTIPRYATCQQSLASKTETSITMNWTSDNTIDYVWYSKDGGSNWVAVGSVNATSGSYTISGLTANTTYSIKTRVRRKDSQLTTDSTATSVTTYKLVAQSMRSKTVNSITMNWSLDTTANYIWYSINNGSTWVAVGSVNATSGSYTITGLSPNTAYNIKTRARRSATSTTSDSVVNAITTYDIAKITGSANWTIENNTSVTYDNPSGAIVAIGIFNTSGNTVYVPYRNITSSPYTFNFTNAENTALYNAIPNDPYGTIRIYLRTTVNGTSYYDYVERTITANQNLCKPVFSNFTYIDEDTNVTNLTGNNQILVNGLSNPRVIISVANKAVAKNGATMSKYRVKIGDQTVEKDYLSNTNMGFPFNDVISPIIEVYAIDSRGFETKVTKTAIWKDYSKPKITEMKLDRENGIGTKVLFNFEADYWNGNFGTTNNTITTLYFRYRIKNGSYGNWISILNFVQYSNGKVTTISGSFLPTTDNGNTPIEFVVGTEYDIQFHIDDCTRAILSVNSASQPLNNGIPGRDLFKDSNGNYHEGINQLAEPDYTFSVNGDTHLKGNLILDDVKNIELGKLERYSGNLNDIAKTKLVYASDATNTPIGANGYCETEIYDTTYKYQKFSNAGNNQTYERKMKNGTWEPWKEIAVIETGTWTPTINTQENVAPTITYTFQRGNYFKIGNLVYVDFYIRGKITAVNGSNNYGTINGLPFKASYDNYYFGQMSLNLGVHYNLIYNPGNLVLDIVGGGNNIRMQRADGASAGSIYVTPSSYFEIGGSGWYRAE